MDDDEKKNEQDGVNKKEWNWSENVLEVSKGTGMMVVNICGHLYPPITMKKSVLWLKDNFIPKEYDVFIVSYPKCGTTWMQKICVEIMKLVLNKTKSVSMDKIKHDDKYLNIDCSKLYLDGKFSNIYYLESMINNNITYFLSYLYCTNKLYQSNNNFLRFWKSHSFISSFPSKDTKNNKFILIIRDPKDVIISYYEYLKLVGYPIFKCEFAKFFELFITGLVPGGNYWEWAVNWNNKYMNNNGNILWVYYEDLKNDTSKQIHRIIKFLNFENIINKEDEIETIIENSSFNKMKSMIKNGQDNYPLDFFRKGVVGDHKNVLSSEQINVLNMITNCKFHSSKIKYWQQ
eukprot:401416_1